MHVEDELDDLYLDEDDIQEEGDSAEEKPAESDENLNEADEEDTDPQKEGDKEDDAGDEENPDEDDEGKEDEEIDLKDLDKYESGIENILASFGVEGGIIKFSDDTEVPFSELEPETQTKVLDTLIEGKISEEVNKFQLTDDEIAVLNMGRESKKPLQEVIEELASQRAQVLFSQMQTDSTDFDNMEDDALFLKYLQENNPEASPEEIEKALSDSKNLPYYSKFVGTIREDYKDKQDAKNREIENAQKAKEMEVIEQEREEIVNSSLEIEEIIGVPIDDDSRNEVLADILEVNEYGDSKFMEQVFSDPQKLFTVAWLAKYGEEHSLSKDTYWKKKVTAAYKKGKSDALAGAKSTSVSYNAKKEKSQDSKTKTKQKAAFLRTPMQGGSSGEIDELYKD